MTKTIAVTSLRLILSLAISGPAQAWPEPSSAIDCAWGGEPRECEALSMALAYKHAPARSYVHKAEHAPASPARTRPPDRDEDPLASMHFE